MQRIAKEGGKIVAIGRREDELKKLQDQHGAALCEIVVADLSTQRGQDGVVDALIEHSADSLVNNAGVFRENLCTDFGRDEFEEIMSTNCTAPLFISRGIAKHWLRQNEQKTQQPGQYNIVNISSAASLSPLKGHCVYGLAKAGMDYWCVCCVLCVFVIHT